MPKRLLGLRFSKQRRQINIVVFLIVTVVLAWLWIANQSHDQRITRLEISDCKKSRVTQDRDAQKSCHDTLEAADRQRPLLGIRITLRRANYPCPLTEEQSHELRLVINKEGGR